jgi:hypothetical protein
MRNRGAFSFRGRLADSDPTGSYFQVQRLALPFCVVEIILSCFQTGRMYEWARAHFFVGRDKWRSA